MLLDLGKAVSFGLCILSLYSVLMNAFFEPNTTWEHRLALGVSRLVLAGCVCLASGLLFSLPIRTNVDRGVPVWKTLPVVVFLWAAVGMAVLFALAWYVRCGGNNSFGYRFDCF